LLGATPPSLTALAGIGLTLLGLVLYLLEPYRQNG
jgi:hypothetical protein